MSAQLNGPSLGKLSQLVPSTVNHCLDATKDNANTNSFAIRRIPNVEQNNVHNSVSSLLMPSYQQYSDTLIVQCTLGNSQYQESYQARLSNPFHITHEECRLWAASALNKTSKTILLEELRHVDFRNQYQIKNSQCTYSAVAYNSNAQDK